MGYIMTKIVLVFLSLHFPASQSHTLIPNMPRHVSGADSPGVSSVQYLPHLHLRQVLNRKPNGLRQDTT